jgi:hypothetical protein
MTKDICQEYMLLIIALVIIVASVSALAYSNSKLADCDSMGGKIVQFLDEGSREGCAQFKTLFYLSFVGLAVGAALVVVHFVRKR